MSIQREQLSDLFAALKAGRLSRREFVVRASAAGLTAAGIAFAVNSLDMRGARAQDATPAASPSASPAVAASVGRPAVGFENVTRGQGGQLNVLLWQAVTLLNPHIATGTKDYFGASFVLEPLLNYALDSTLVTNLAAEVPTVENGGLSEDLSTVTYKLLPNVVWSDGEPFTAKDVKFTWEWITNPAHLATDQTVYSVISAVDVIDDLTVKLTFAKPTLAWYVPFTGTGGGGAVIPGHLWNFDATSTDYDNTFRTAPIGTGPYTVTTFSENDQVTYTANDKYREANKPFFSGVNLKGGGDPASAGQAVLQTGDFDYAWNLQVDPSVLKQLASGGKGYLLPTEGASIEQIFINFSDPNNDDDGERSSLKHPHPAFSDKAVRQALATAIDRDTIANQLYGAGSNSTPDRLVGIPAYESKNVSFSFDTDAANKLLDDAGWTKNGDIREKNGVQLKWTYSTTINDVRQKTQAIVKKNLADIGIEVDLQSVDSGIYFDSSAGNDQNYYHFYQDITMYTNGPTSPYPLDYMAGFYAGKNNVNVSQKANQWSGTNFSRYVNPDYDASYEEASLSTDPERVATLFIQQNDILINDAAVIPLVQRGFNAAVSNRMLKDNLGESPFEGDFWNIANWRTVLE